MGINDRTGFIFFSLPCSYLIILSDKSFNQTGRKSDLDFNKIMLNKVHERDTGLTFLKSMWVVLDSPSDRCQPGGEPATSTFLSANWPITGKEMLKVNSAKLLKKTSFSGSTQILSGYFIKLFKNQTIKCMGGEWINIFEINVGCTGFPVRPVSAGRGTSDL